MSFSSYRNLSFDLFKSCFLPSNFQDFFFIVSNIFMHGNKFLKIWQYISTNTHTNISNHLNLTKTCLSASPFMSPLWSSNPCQSLWPQQLPYPWYKKDPNFSNQFNPIHLFSPPFHFVITQVSSDRVSELRSVWFRSPILGIPEISAVWF